MSDISQRQMRIRKRKASKLPWYLQQIAFAENPLRISKQHWKRSLESHGAASPVKYLIKNGKPVE